MPGTNGTVTALEVAGNRLYARGNFDTAGGAVVSGLAVWDGTQWSAVELPQGFMILCMESDGQDLYIGGTPANPDDLDPAYQSGVLRREGDAWIPLPASNPGGPYNQVEGIHITGNSLYATGYVRFASDNGTPVAKWDGKQWSRLGEAPSSGQVAVWNSKVFLANERDISVYDGTEWTTIGTVEGSRINTIVASQAGVFIGGHFNSVNGLQATGIARWDGTQWSNLVSDWFGLNGSAYAILPVGSDLYVGGDFGFAGGWRAGYIAKWNGSQWSTLGQGENNGVIGYGDTSVQCLAAGAGGIYVGGQFVATQEGAARNLVLWDGSGFKQVGVNLNGLDLPASDLLPVNGKLYAAGSFRTAGSVHANGIACWNGTTWSGLGQGMNGPVNALAHDGTYLYAAGAFTQAGGVAAGRIAKWNGINWSTLGTGLREEVLALALFQAALYAGTEKGLYRWAGTSWDPVVGTIGLRVTALLAYGPALYVAGALGEIQGTYHNGIARWDGTKWHRMGSGLTDTAGSVYHVSAYQDYIFVAGYFGRAGGRKVEHFAKWNGTEWEPVPQIPGPPTAIAASSQGLIGVFGQQVARWDGHAWQYLGHVSGVSAMAATANDIYVTGQFFQAGSVAASNFGRLAFHGSRLSAGSAHLPAAGDQGTISVDTSGACSPTLASLADWIELVPGETTGNQSTVRYVVQPNPEFYPRTAAVWIGSDWFTVRQDAREASLVPRLLSTAETFTGIALANLGDSTLTATITAHGPDGNHLFGPGIRNPVSADIAPGYQSALLASELFGGLSAQPVGGSAVVEGDLDGLCAFSLTSRWDLKAQDGSVPGQPVDCEGLLFPVLQPNGQTEIRVRRSSTWGSVATFALFSAEGERKGLQASREIPPDGELITSPEQLFPNETIVSSDYLLQEFPFVGAAEVWFGKPGVHTASLPALPRSAAGPQLYAPQFAVGYPGIKSTLVLVNAESVPAKATLRFFNDQGKPVGSAKQVSLAPNGKLTLDDNGLFGPLLEGLTGYVSILSEYDLAGCVVFGDVQGNSFQSALPLVKDLEQEFVVSHLASTSSYFTGMAMVNPNPAQATITMEVFSKDGASIGTQTEVLPPSGRKSRLLTEYFPQLVGREISSGYLVIKGNQPLACFALFGPTDSSSLSAIPAQTIRTTEEE